jgi:hypothetical protein
MAMSLIHVVIHRTLDGAPERRYRADQNDAVGQGEHHPETDTRGINGGGAVQAEEQRSNGAIGDRTERRHSAREIRDALLDMSISLEELLPILEAARATEAALRATLLRLTPGTVVTPASVGDYVPERPPVTPAVTAGGDRDTVAETAPPSDPVIVPPISAGPAAEPVAPSPPQYLVTLDEGAEDPPADAVATEELHSIAVVISGPRGPVDLARVHAALDSIDGVDNLRLGRYDRSGVVVYVETARDPGELPLQQALNSVFAEGVRGEWATPEEYLVTVGAA